MALEIVLDHRIIDCDGDEVMEGSIIIDSRSKKSEQTIQMRNDSDINLIHMETIGKVKINNEMLCKYWNINVRRLIGNKLTQLNMPKKFKIY